MLLIEPLQKHQNYADFVTQHTGSFENIFDMAMQNSISITKQCVPGELLMFDKVENKITRFFDKSGYIIQSEGDNPGDFIQTSGGIGYMQIENTFIIS